MDAANKEHNILEHCFQWLRDSDLFRDFYKDVDNYRQAPVLSKKELIPILENHFKLKKESKGVYLVRSGGSTQNPLIFPVDITENHTQRQVLADSLTAAGIFSPTTIALNMFPYTDMYRTAAIMDDVLEKCSATSLPMSAHAKYEDICHTAKHFEPDYLFGTPSKTLRLLEHLKEKQETLNIPNFLFGGEFLRPGLQKMIREIINVKQIYSLYGSAETGIWGWCDFSAKPSFFQIIPGIIVEIVEADENGFGTIVVTNTFRKRFPVFRYAVGDVGRLTEENGITYLELKSRESKSFILCEQHFDLEEFSALIAESEAFQFRLSTTEQLVEQLEILLVQQVPEDQEERFLAERTALLREKVFYNEKWMKAEVKLVQAEELFTDPNTSKTPALIDLR